MIIFAKYYEDKFFIGSAHTEPKVNRDFTGKSLKKLT